MKKLLVLAAVSAMAMGAKAEYAYTTTVTISDARAVYFMYDNSLDYDFAEQWNQETKMLFSGDRPVVGETWAEQFAWLNSTSMGQESKATYMGNDVFSMDLNRSEPRQFMLVALFNADEFAPGMQYAVYSGIAPGSDAEDKSFQIVSTIATGTAPTDGSPTPAPEPTSGLLLLLGVAGLALKRKRA